MKPARKPEVLAVLLGELIVASRSQPGIAYRIKRSDWLCPCPARVSHCSHIRAARDAVADLALLPLPQGCDEEFEGFGPVLKLASPPPCAMCHGPHAIHDDVGWFFEACRDDCDAIAAADCVDYGTGAL